jgi:DNA end-binding protein Ku
VFTRVRQSAVDLQEKTVRPESIVKGYEFEKDRFVEVGREELKSLAPKTSTAMQIEEFVQLAEVDPVYFETSYYVVPEQAGERAYALLYKSMLNTGLVAVADLAMHAREHIVILRPGRTGLLAHTMFFTNEVHADEEYRADVRLVADKELGLAETLIRSLNQPFEPEKYRDTYRERLESLLAQKVENLPAAPAIAEPRKTAEVLDIAEALRRSLANLKKPAGSAEPTVKPTGDSRKRKSQRSSKRGKTA